MANRERMIVAFVLKGLDIKLTDRALAERMLEAETVVDAIRRRETAQVDLLDRVDKSRVVEKNN